ncbi:MAG: hypothetical protein V5A47_05095 [Bacteroidales bacterium]
MALSFIIFNEPYKLELLSGVEKLIFIFLMVKLRYGVFRSSTKGYNRSDASGKSGAV